MCRWLAVSPVINGMGVLIGYVCVQKPVTLAEAPDYYQVITHPTGGWGGMPLSRTHTHPTQLQPVPDLMGRVWGRFEHDAEEGQEPR